MDILNYPELRKIKAGDNYDLARLEAIQEPTDKEYLNAILSKATSTTNILRESRRFLFAILIELAVIIYLLWR